MFTTTAPRRGKEKELLCTGGNKESGRKKEREKERKKEREKESRLSDINHRLLNTQRCGLGRSRFNDNNKQMKKMTLDFL